MEIAEQFDAAIEVGHALAEATLAEIPAKRGVVLLVDKDSRPIVLLTAADMRSRVRNRLAEPADDEKGKKLDLREITDKIYYKLTRSHFETDLEYLRLVTQIFPMRYTQIISWKAPWFIHVDSAHATPQFTVSRKVLGAAGRFFGPFLKAGDAEKYIENLSDVFRLCRDVKCLRQAPNASGCSWSEMGKCVGVGEGRMAMDDYRRLLDDAGDFIAGDRTEIVAGLTEQMKLAAGKLEFEQAAVIKRRIDRMAELDRPAYRFVKPAEGFKYVFVQRGAGRKQCTVFFINGPEISGPFELPCPLEEKAVDKILARIKKLDTSVSAADGIGKLNMGLAARILFADDARSGLVISWDNSITTQALTEQIAASADLLNITLGKSDNK